MADAIVTPSATSWPPTTPVRRRVRRSDPPRRRVRARRFLDERPWRPRAVADVSREVYVELGRGEFREGRGLDALLRAYRLGARVAWRGFVEAGGRPAWSHVLYSLGEASSPTSTGCRRGRRGLRADPVGSGGRDASASGAPDPPALVASPRRGRTSRAAADAAGWAVPNPRDAVAESEDPERSPAAWAPTCRAAPTAAVAFVPDVHAPRRRPSSSSRSATARRARPRGRPAEAASAPSAPAPAAARRRRPRPLATADEHLADLLLAADRKLAADLADRRPRPARRPPGPAAREARPRPCRPGSTTRGGWRRRRRARRPPADRPLPPGQLRERIGRLEDPDGRFELALALRARRATRRAT